MDEQELPLNLEELLHDSVVEIFRHEDFQKYQKWMHSHIASYYRLDLFSRIPSEALYSLATSLGLFIWNATPLPGEGFKVRKIPNPGRNSKCPCGSGKKYKRCCYAGQPPMDLLDQDAMWPFVFDLLSKEQLNNALAQQLFPIRALAQGAEICLEKNKPKKAYTYLNDYFSASSFRETGADAAIAFLAWLDACEQLGYSLKKRKMLRHIIETAPASPLRSEAWQRFSTILMDEGDAKAAWKAFHKARRDEPDNPGIGLLEVQLLMAEDKYALAQQRAAFLVKRLNRLDIPDSDPMLGYLRSIADNPQQGNMEMEFSMVDDMGRELVDWLDKVKDQPLPEYHFEPLEAAKAEDKEDDFDFPRIRKGDIALLTPEYLNDVQEGWEDIAPVEKPVSVNPQPFFYDPPWEPEADFSWIDFLFDHPEAFDCLDILDDLIGLASLHPNWGAPSFTTMVYEPLMTRALALSGQIILSLPPDRHIPWFVADNRCLLRTLMRHSADLGNQGKTEGEQEVHEQLIRINPTDNHGLRCILMDSYLKNGQDEKALALAARFPDDMFAEILYGQTLALFRQGRRQEADMALETAINRLPKVARFLVAARVKKPQINPYGMTLGGDDQAWEYRQDMRDTWKSVRGALSWLKKMR